jgi:hypothetical protein
VVFISFLWRIFVLAETLDNFMGGSLFSLNTSNIKGGNGFVKYLPPVPRPSPPFASSITTFPSSITTFRLVHHHLSPRPSPPFVVDVYDFKRLFRFPKIFKIFFKLKRIF